MSARRIAIFALLGAVAASAAAPARAQAPAQTTFTCAECGMTGEFASRFTARLVSGGATRVFCDIGDLVSFIERTAPRQYSASVRDFVSGEWVDAAAAWYVVDKKAYATPMGWGVAAFRERPATGTALDFGALRTALPR